MGSSMGLSIRDAATERLVRTLAKRKGVGLTEAVRLAVGTELQRLDREPPLRERVAAIRKSIVARGRTGKRTTRRSSTISATTADVSRRFGDHRDARRRS